MGDVEAGIALVVIIVSALGIWAVKRCKELSVRNATIKRGMGVIDYRYCELSENKVMFSNGQATAEQTRDKFYFGLSAEHEYGKEVWLAEVSEDVYNKYEDGDVYDPRQEA